MKKKIKSLYIAVDGSSASGKTTASKIISKEFKLKLLSSGKLYRYIAYKIIKNKNKYNKNIIKKFSKSISVNPDFSRFNPWLPSVCHNGSPL